MHLTSSQTLDGERTRWSRRTTWAALLGIAFLAGCAWAQQSPPASEPKDPPKEKQAQADTSPDTPEQVPPRALPKGRPTAEGIRPAGSIPSVRPHKTLPTGEKAVPGKQAEEPKKPITQSTARPSKRSIAQKLTPDPNAKWACEAPLQTHKPVWRGDEKLTFTFHIRNEGTANLMINAKGG